MVSRQTYLHVGLESAVLRLHKFAPTALSFASGTVQEEPDPGSMQDRNDSDQPSATGSNSDQGGTSTKTSHGSQPSQYPICWFEDEETQMALRWHLFVGVLWDSKAPQTLPWRIRLHFTAYPSSQILPFDTHVLTQIQYYYKNSLKQALCLQYGTQKVAMNLTKEFHSKLWEAVCTSNLRLFDSVHTETALRSLEHLVPIRLYLGPQGALSSSAPLQRSCSRRKDGYTRTLGMLLQEWLPDLFLISTDGHGIVPTDAVYSWRVQGIQPTLSISLTEMWEELCHPDHFCYITVITR